MTLKEEALAKHYEWKGKIEVISRTPIKNREQLSLAYTPGVAEPCLELSLIHISEAGLPLLCPLPEGDCPVP